MRGLIHDETLKQLKSQLQKKEVEYEAFKTELSGLQRELSAKQESVIGLKKRIEELNRSVIDEVGARMTEHALLRYVERYMGIDLEKLESRLLDTKTRNVIETIGSGKIPSVDCVLVVKDKVVVTVV